MPEATTMMRDRFCPVIERRLSQSSIRQRMMHGIGAFVDKYSNILYSMNMADRYSFSAKDRDVIYDAAGISEREIADAIKASPYIYDDNKTQSNPFYNMCMLVIRVLMKLKYDNEALYVATYMQLQMYVSIHSGRWQSRPNKNIMDYTLATLDKSYRITQVSSIFEFIMDNAKTVLDTYGDWIYTPPNKPLPKTERKVGSGRKTMITIDPGSDAENALIIGQFWNRLKQKVIKIAQEFYVNQKSGRYLNYDTEVHNAEEIRSLDNDSYALDRIASTVYGKLINHQFKQQWLKMSITQSAVSYSKLSTLFDDIIDNDDEERLRKVIQGMLEYFTIISGYPIDQIGTSKFISVMSTAYGSGTNQEPVKSIKDTLEIWVTENSVRYGRSAYGRTASIAYKKSLFMTIVYIVNYEAKLMT